MSSITQSAMSSPIVSIQHLRSPSEPGEQLDKDQIITLKKLSLPLFQSRVSAGFPSPADDYIERYLDLNELLIQHPSSTFLARAQGDSMIEIGIHCGDILIVDRAVEASHLDVVVAALDGELVCKQLDTHHQRLLPANSQYPEIAIASLSDFMVEGVVVASIRCHRTIPDFEKTGRQ